MEKQPFWNSYAVFFDELSHCAILTMSIHSPLLLGVTSSGF
ncbi:26237_t:CDS:2 [Gigaspora rosea]|nr:26237_t:CDS:2 [Gigaspora rosea]